jgi:hypothetical protein
VSVVADVVVSVVVVVDVNVNVNVNVWERRAPFRRRLPDGLDGLKRAVT